MTTPRVFVFFGVTAAIVALSACGTSVPVSSSQPKGAPFARSERSFTVLYSFKGGPGDGESPQGVALGPGSSLFGTTNDGGHIHPRDCQSSGCGTVYKYQNSMTELIYLFQPQPLGFHPVGSLVSRNGVFYGAAQGGLYDDGMVFSLSQNPSGDWVETTLYNFKGAPDGFDVAGVGYIDARGNLFGTTRSGGTGRACLYQDSGCGTVFELQPPTESSGSWKESILHSFQGSPGDGADPSNSLVRKGDSFYGTTQWGGASGKCPYSTGCGVIYKITPYGSGASERIDYSFSVGSSSNDGASPQAIVDGGDGNLYGITAFGGGGGGTTCHYTRAIYGCGTAFSIPFKHGKNARDTILYAFSGTPDGSDPDSFSGTAATGFYGLAYYGGSTGCNTQFGCGTIFGIARSGSGWTETTLHTFLKSDGAYPIGPIVLRGSRLFGTAQIGGSAPCECGVLYSITLDN